MASEIGGWVAGRDWSAGRGWGGPAGTGVRTVAAQAMWLPPRDRVCVWPSRGNTPPHQMRKRIGGASANWRTRGSPRKGGGGGRRQASGARAGSWTWRREEPGRREDGRAAGAGQGGGAERRVCSARHNQSSRALPLASDGAHLRLLHCKQRQRDTRDTRGARVEGEGRGWAGPGGADGEHTAVLCGGGVLRLETRWVSWRRAPLHAPISAPTRFCTGRWWWRGGRRVGRSCTGRLSTPAPPSSCPPLTLSSSHPPLPFLLPPTRQGLGTCVESRKQYVRTKNGENPNPNLNITPGSVGTTGESSECRVWHNKPSPLPPPDAALLAPDSVQRGWRYGLLLLQPDFRL